MKKIASLLIVVASATFALADDDLLPANRPNFSTNGTVLPFQQIILENGFSLNLNGGDRTISGTESEFRIGFAKGWEFDFFTPNFIHRLTGSPDQGFGDSAFQFVRGFTLPQGWLVTAAVGATLPSGHPDLSAGSINPTSFLSFEHPIGKKWDFTNSLYDTFQNGSGTFTSQFSNASMMSVDLGKNVGAFAELYTIFGQGIQPTFIPHFGVTFAHSATQMVDFHIGEDTSAGQWFFGFGYSKKLK